jgi:hypothetical protein
MSRSRNTAGLVKHISSSTWPVQLASKHQLFHCLVSRARKLSRLKGISLHLQLCMPALNLLYFFEVRCLGQVIGLSETGIDILRDEPHGPLLSLVQALQRWG